MYTDAEVDAIDVQETLRIKAIPERLMWADPSDCMLIGAPGLAALEPAVNDELTLSGLGWYEKLGATKSSSWKARSRGSRSV